MDVIREIVNCSLNVTSERSEGLAIRAFSPPAVASLIFLASPFDRGGLSLHRRD